LIPPREEQRKRHPDPKGPGFLSHAAGTLLAGGLACLPLAAGLVSEFLPQRTWPLVLVGCVLAVGLSGKNQRAEDTFMTLFPLAILVSLILRGFNL
jgi:hypothetical protein